MLRSARGNAKGMLKKLRILLVEDDLCSSRVITRMLERRGHDVVASVTSGEEARQEELPH